MTASSVALAPPEGRRPTAKPRFRLRRPRLLTLAAYLVLLIVLAPLIVVFGTAMNAQSMSFPPQEWTLEWMIAALRDPKFLGGAINSTLVALVAAGLSTGFALPVALLVSKLPLRWGRIVSLAFLGPLLIPSIIFALAIYQIMVYSLGSANPVALMIGHIIVTLPFPVRTITAAAEDLDPALSDAAASIGAPPWLTFRTITLPLLKPGIVAGFLFAFLVSWNDFNISIFLAPFNFQLLPIQIYEYLLFEYKPLIAAVAAWSVIGTGTLILIIDRLVGLNVFIGRR